MSRDSDWEDDGPRRPMDRWGEEEPDAGPEPSSQQRSGVVTSAGVITLILGSLVLLAGLCGGGIMAVAGTAEMNRGGMFPAARGALFVAFLVCLLILFWGIGAVASGIGLIGRRNWARVLTLILSGFGAVAGLIFLLIAVAVWFAPNRGGPEVGFLILGYLFYLFLGLLFLGYGLWTYLILLSARYSAEFG